MIETFGPLQFILTVFLGVYLAMSLASMLTLSFKYKNYKETYLLLSEYILVENSKKYILLASKEEINRNRNHIGGAYKTGFHFNKEIYYDKKYGTIKLNDGYIFNSSMLYFDFYSVYWYYKLKRRFIRKGMSVAELREEKLNKLLR